jgi:hypothetical protein
MGQKNFEIDESDLLNINDESLEHFDSEIVSKSSFQYINIIGRGGLVGYGKFSIKKQKKYMQ